MNLKTIKDTAQNLLSQKKHRECIEFLETALDKYPNNFFIYQTILNSLVKLGNKELILKHVHLVQEKLVNSVKKNQLIIGAYIHLSKFKWAKAQTSANFNQINMDFILNAKNAISAGAYSGAELLSMTLVLKAHYDHLQCNKEQNLKYLNKNDIDGIYCFKAAKNIKKKVLIVSGAPRSGTTALGKVLNVSSQVALFIERYNSTQGYHPNMFQEKYLYRHNYQKLPHSKQYESLREKLATAIYIGDKIPLFFLSWDITAKNFKPEEIVIFHIVRNIYDISSSYNSRAKNALVGIDPSWYPTRDTLAACNESNSMNQNVVKALEDSAFRSSIYIIEYDKIFSSIHNLEKLFKLLNLDMNKINHKKLEMFVNQAKELRDKQRILSAADKATINNHFNFDLYNKILSKAIMM